MFNVFTEKKALKYIFFCCTVTKKTYVLFYFSYIFLKHCNARAACLKNMVVPWYYCVDGFWDGKPLFLHFFCDFWTDFLTLLCNSCFGLKHIYELLFDPLHSADVSCSANGKKATGSKKDDDGSFPVKIQGAGVEPFELQVSSSQINIHESGVTSHLVVWFVLISNANICQQNI